MSSPTRRTGYRSRSSRVRVLHVDDELGFAELTAERLVRENDRIETLTAESAAEGLDLLAAADHGIDCVVSDYDMPERNGLDFLAAVRETCDLPFVLYTGRGSEQVASDAISAGVTDYLQKASGSDQYALLANKVVNAVDRHRAETSYRELFEKAAAGLALHDPETGAFIEANQSVVDVLGRDRAELLAGGIEDVATVPAQADRERTLLTHLRRARAGETVTLEERCRRPDGTRFWLRLQFQSIEIDGRSLVLSQMRDVTDRKRYGETLSALHSSMADLVGAASTRQVVDCVTATVEDLLDADRAAVFLHEPGMAGLSIAAATAEWSPERVGDAAVSLSSESPVARAFIEGDPMEVAETAVFGSDDARDRGRALLVGLGEHGVLAVGGDGTAGFGADSREFAEILAGAAGVALDRIRRDREIDSSRAELRSRTDEMERLRRANGTLRNLGTALPEAETREDVYEAVCAAFGALDAVALSWVGVPDDEGAVDYPAWRGDVPQYLDSVPLDGESDEPAVVVARTGTTVRIDDTAVDRHREPWRRTALAHGVDAVRALPIEADGVVYGVLSVLGTDRTAFDGRFDDVLATVAASAGRRIDAIERHQGALASAATDVTYEFAADAHPLGRLGAELDCRLDVRGVLRKTAGRHCVSLDVTDGDPDRVCALARRLAAIRSASVVSASEDSGRLDLELETPLLGVGLPDGAATVSRFRASASSVRTTLTIARPGDVRTVAERIQRRYPAATLCAKRRRDDAHDDHERLLAFGESLTPRQREVAQVAHVEGYFDSPRRLTGDELGETLGISGQAVNKHLRTAQRKLLEAAFEGELDVATTAR